MVRAEKTEKTEKTRRTADERRADLVEAGLREFAKTGLHGTAVSAITDAVGITQPYAFSLFRSKRELFLAAGEHMMDRFEAQCREAAESAPDDEQFAAIQDAAGALVTDPTMLPFLMQWFAASSSDDEVRAAARRRVDRLMELVQERGGVGPDEAHTFLAQGLLCAVATTLQMPHLLTGELREYAERC